MTAAAALDAPESLEHGLVRSCILAKNPYPVGQTPFWVIRTTSYVHLPVYNPAILTSVQVFNLHLQSVNGAEPGAAGMSIPMNDTFFSFSIELSNRRWGRTPVPKFLNLMRALASRVGG